MTEENDDGYALRVRDESTNRRSTQLYTMMECQLFHHINTQIIETIKKLETIDTMNWEVTTVQRNILDTGC